MFQIEKTYTSWNRQRIARHICYWLAWLIFYATVNSSYSDYGFITWIEVELVIMLVKLPFTYFVIYYLVPTFLVKKKYIPFIIFAVIFGFIGAFMVSGLYKFVLNPYLFEIDGRVIKTKSYVYIVLDLIYIASLPTILKLLQRQIQQEKWAMQMAEQKLDAELKLLKNQLHPHFLFNTLNNLYGMVLTQHPQAADVVVRLSDMMSYMLYECERDQIPLEQEILNLQNYIELEKIRYGKRLDIEFNTDENLTGKFIVPLLLIPFLENAFKHGVEQSEIKSWVKINIQLAANDLSFTIENSLPQGEPDQRFLPNTHSGVGLSNVRKRLQLLYPERHHLELQEEDTFFVDLKLQLYDQMLNR